MRVFQIWRYTIHMLIVLSTLLHTHTHTSQINKYKGARARSENTGFIWKVRSCVYGYVWIGNCGCGTLATFNYDGRN